MLDTGVVTKRESEVDTEVLIYCFFEEEQGVLAFNKEKCVTSTNSKDLEAENARVVGCQAKCSHPMCQYEFPS